VARGSGLCGLIAATQLYVPVYTIVNRWKRNNVWDPEKAARNIIRHGVSFEEAQEAFTDPFALVLDNYDIGDEQRLMIIGMSGRLTLLASVFIEFEAPDAFVIRIISARKATAYEENIYREAQEGN